MAQYGSDKIRVGVVELRKFVSEHRIDSAHPTFLRLILWQRPLLLMRWIVAVY